MRRFLVTLVLPVMAILVLSNAELIGGQRTLFLRDVFGTHLEKKWVLAEAMAEGELPIIDPFQDRGQPLLGNPNSVSFYPGNLLYLVAPFFWSFNAHFWIHLLIAPFTAFWLARAWGLEREPAWAAGVVFAASGYFWSNLNFYNLVAGAAWAPALVAAAIGLAAAPGRRRVAALAAIWALLLVSGDPMTAALALGAALSAAAVRSGARSLLSWPLGCGLALGTVLAAPQLVEFARILPLTYRGYWGYSTEAATSGSWPPVAVLDWLIPFPFGTPDLSFWGGDLLYGEPLLFFTLYPGLLALALVWAAGRPATRAAWWAWSLTFLGVFLALGQANPIVTWMLRLPGAAVLRYPIKCWILVAMGGSLLAGLGWRRAFDGEGGALTRPLRVLAGVLLPIWIVLSALPERVERLLGALIPERFTEAFVTEQRLRLAGLCLLSLLLLGLFALALRAGRRRPAAAAALLLVLHVGSQVWFLKPLVPSDRIDTYLQPRELLELVPRGVLVAHGESGDLFGPDQVYSWDLPDLSLVNLERRAFAHLQPAAGILQGRAYAFNGSTEGLDSFLTRATGQAVSQLPDRQRLRILAASAVERLILTRPLGPECAQAVRLVGMRETGWGPIWVYRIEGAAPEIYLAERVHRAPHLNRALEIMSEEGFDPRLEVVLPGEAPFRQAASGALRVHRAESELIELEVRLEGEGLLVVQRPLLPVYRAQVDGVDTPIQAANIHRMGVAVGQGQHEVRLWVDRRPLHWSSGLSLAALVVAAWLALGRRAPAAGAGMI